MTAAHTRSGDNYRHKAALVAERPCLADLNLRPRSWVVKPEPFDQSPQLLLAQR